MAIVGDTAIRSTARSIGQLRQSLTVASDPAAEVQELAQSALAKSNTNASHNTYLWQDPAWTIAEAIHAAHLLTAQPQGPLTGIPISVKDCFDLAGSPTSCGTRFYRELNGPATQDSWLVHQLRQAGAIIVGKTHLHPLAYGITGENAEFGDCLQPHNPAALTGGSSSGAAASVLEGSAVAAIGTDTGGSIRVPAALCGLAGYRASLGRGDWTGAAHLAPSFDTMGCLFHDLEDAETLASIFNPRDPQPTATHLPGTFAVVNPAFLHDCEPPVVEALNQSRKELESLGLQSVVIDVGWWSDSMDIFAPIQASEAAILHQGHFDNFEPSIRQRLAWGASLTASEIAALRSRHELFSNRMDQLLGAHSLLLLPAAPVTQLTAGADHSQTRVRLLRYTTPISLAGMPAITIPFTNQGLPAGGTQLVAAREDDARLIGLATLIGRQRTIASSDQHPSC